MPVSDRDHFDALRAADQRAVELLATANAANISRTREAIAILISVISVIVAVAAITLHH
jgi:hypothetical protein